MPEVQAVRPLTQRNEWTPREPAERTASARDAGCGDQHRCSDRQCQQTATVEPRRLVVDEQDGTDESHQKEADRHAEPGQRLRREASRRGDGEPRQCGAYQQLLCPGVGAVVHTTEIIRVVQHSHPQRRCGCSDEQQQCCQPESVSSSCQRSERHHDERPDEIPLFLNGQRPDVSERARAEQGLEVAGVIEDEMPVGDVRKRGDGVAAHRVPLRWYTPEPSGSDARRHDHHQRRHESPESPDPEGPQGDPARCGIFAEKQPGDQEPGDDEEEVDTEKAATHPGDVEVVAKHGRDGESTEAVERSCVGKAWRWGRRQVQ